MSEIPMSATGRRLSPVRARSLPGAKILSPTVGAAVLVTVWSLLLMALTWRTWGDLGRDTGYDLLAAARTSHGDLPYVDYVYYYGPLSPFLLGGLYAAFGQSVATAVALGIGITAGIIALTFVLGGRLAGPVGGGLAGVLAATAALGTANNSYILPHTTSAPLATLLTLGAALLLVRFADDPGRRRMLVAAGVLSGLVVLTRLEVAGPLGLVLAAWAALRVVDAPQGRREAIRDVLALLAPAALLPLVVLAAFLTAVSPHDLLLNNLYPRSMLKAGGNVVLKGQAPMTISSFVAAGAKVVVYAAIVSAMALVAALLGRDARGRRIALLGAAVALVLAAGIVAARPETIRYYLQFAYAWVPIGAALVTLALAWWLRREGTLWTAHGQAPLLVSAILAATAASSYDAFYPHARPGGPQTTAYLLPFVALLLVYLHQAAPRITPTMRVLGGAWIAVLAVAGAGLVAHDAGGESAIVRSPHGTIAATPAQAGAYQGAVDAIERRTKSGDPVLLAPQMTSLYVMTGRTDPLRQLSLLPGALATPSDEQAAIGRLVDVDVAVVDRRKLALYGQGAFGTTFDKTLGAWLRREFRRVETVRGTGPGARVLDVYQRRGT
jgi:hypothetical protein